MIYSHKLFTKNKQKSFCNSIIYVQLLLLLFYNKILIILSYNYNKILCDYCAIYIIQIYFDIFVCFKNIN